jgi:hypothetical protein
VDQHVRFFSALLDELIGLFEYTADVFVGRVFNFEGKVPYFTRIHEVLSSYRTNRADVMLFE